jgi:hypothetical protein
MRANTLVIGFSIVIEFFLHPFFSTVQCQGGLFGGTGQPVYASRPSPEALPINSPTVGSLFQFSKASVDMYKGMASINVPIYEVTVQNVTIPISLQYKATSIKPNQQVSWLGANWSLNAGGTISLITKGQIDMNNSYYPIDPVQGTYTDPFDEHVFNASCSENVDLTRDAYAFSFNGYSGKIYIDEFNGVHCTNNELKVEIASGAFTEEEIGQASGEVVGCTNSIFKITTGDGTMYFFGGKYKDFSVNKLGVKSAIAWHLYKIITPTNDHIEFEYKVHESTNSNIIFGETVFLLNYTLPYYNSFALADYT